MLDLSFNRMPSESVITSILLIDTALHTITTRYRILAFRKSSMELVFVKEIRGPFSGNTDDYSYTQFDNISNFRMLFNLSIFGETFLLQAERYDEDSNTYTSPMIAFTTLPRAPILYELSEADMEYGNSGIPTSITLRWEPNWSPEVNINAIGYAVYYSLARRLSGDWEEWLPVSAGDGKLILPLDKAFYAVDTPFLTDDPPFDVRFMVTVVDNSVNQLESRASNIVKYELSDCITAIISREAGTLKYEYENDYTRPVTIHLGTERFDSDETQLMLRRTRYQVPFKGHQETYAYELKATAQLIRPLSVVIYIDLILNTRFEIRILRDGKWVQIPATHNLANQTVTFVLHTITNFALLISDTSLSRYNSLLNTARKKFSHYTNLMLAKMPVWSKLRRNPVNSKGAAFLNVFGLEYEEMKFILDYAVNQQYIDTLDVSRLDWVSKFKPAVILESGNIIKVFDDKNILQETHALEDFLTMDDKGSYRPKVLYDNPFIVDYEEQVVYIRRHHPRVKLEVYKSAYELDLIHEANYDTQWHHIWGFIDEFGMLLDLKRLPYESNIEFKERILDVFANPSNASREGLLNGIARELGIRRNAVWAPRSRPFIIKAPMVIINYIKLNGSVIDKEYISFDEKGNIAISPMIGEFDDGLRYLPDKDGQYIISYVTGLEMHTFYNEHDYIFRHQLYSTEGLATDLFRYYINRIKHEIPIEWGWFTWNQTYWDISDKEMAGYGHIPTVLDSRIKGFRKYRAV